SETAQLFYDIVFRYHGMPRIIVCDRDSKFTSLFWRSLCKLMGTKLNLSTAYHPQTDGQSERTNQTLEQYLRIFVNYQQDDWDEHLTGAEFAINNVVSAATGVSPFEASEGFQPRVPVDFLRKVKETRTPAVDSWKERHAAILQRAQDKLQQTQERMKKAADKGRREEKFEVGDQVLVSTKEVLPDNMLLRPNRALRPKYVRLYKVIEVISFVIY
ncbi:MAG TPA: hypothetical protein VE843_11545, partial [Ktedonobacteraceae bacterium]|nr:hypothetical protein [Ktedonobacteraceae bacterium]